MSAATRTRVTSVVEDTWGRSTVYSDAGPDKSAPEGVAAGPTGADRATAGSPARSDVAADPDEEDAPALAAASSSLEPDGSDACRLGRFEAALLATVLEDAIGQLRILDACNTELRTRRTLLELEELTAVKFGVRRARGEADEDELEGVDPKHLRSDRSELRKLDRDRAYLSGLTASTYRELTLDESFVCSRVALLALAAAENEHSTLVADEQRTRRRRRELARQLRQQRNHLRTLGYEADCAIDALRTRVEDAALDGDIRSRYVRRWQEARAEQHEWRLQLERAVPADAAEACKLGADSEQRVHTEIELLVAAEIDDTLRSIEQWMDKYEHDTEKIDLRTQVVKNDYQNSLDRRLDLEATIERHTHEMEAWITFKDEREKERQYRERMRCAAVSVQSWWRGLLVRRQLGPYRAPKKPKPPKK